ncbi:MAG: hypothetical protein LBD59_05570 [Prevotellaceae bacterium]|jgi:hypothetical protein|nr:hypothetical protein [Prevotellaceae bacterium]
MRYKIFKKKMRQGVLTFLLLLAAMPVLGALKDTTHYHDFDRVNGKIMNEIWICSSISFPVDISYDVFHVAFHSVVSSKSGYFVQVKPGEHLDGGVLPTGDVVIQNNASGVFNPVGKPAGVYEYVFVSKKDGFCGMGEDRQAVIRIYLVPQPVGFPVLTNLCPGDNTDVDLNHYMPTEIKYFIDEMGWKLKYRKKGATTFATMPLAIDLNSVGSSEYEAYIDDSQGNFADAYAGMKNTPYLCPTDTAFVTHTVRIRDGQDFTIPDKEVSYCIKSLLSVPETSSTFPVDLRSLLGTSVEGGKWTVEVASGLNIRNDIIPDQANSDNAQIPVYLIKDPILAGSPDTLKFKYEYSNCAGTKDITALNVIITNNFTSVIDTINKADVCRNLVSGVVDLPSIFGFSVPLTSGIWYEEKSGVFEEMVHSSVDISGLTSGSEYIYKYDISNAIDSGLCGVAGQSSKFYLRIRDAENVPNAEAQICEKMFETGITMNLTKYVPLLNDPDRVDQSKITWYAPDGTIITNPDAYQIIAGTGELHDTANVVKKFKYELDSDCGVATGYLFVSAVDSIPTNLETTITLCYTDDYAFHVNLYQAAGIAGLKGVFKFVPSEGSPNNKTLPSNYNPNSIVDLNVHEIFGDNNTADSETYVFEYIPASDECIKGKMKVKIIVTKYLNN